MARTAEQLRHDAEQIWQAGVEAVKPQRLFADQVRVENGLLVVADELELPVASFERIFVVGGGKAGAGMVQGLEASLGERIAKQKQLAGIVSVPADCLAPTRSIELVAGRPPGINEPRPEGAAATGRMLELVSGLTEKDLCICLLSGGGSALLPAPIDGISLEQKSAITRLLSGAGATINQLNAVRSQLSRIKGGGLARACRAGNLLTLIVSDVLGDPLDVIASGPAVASGSTPADALQILSDLGVESHPDAEPTVNKLNELASYSDSKPSPTAKVHNIILANNAAAVDAAGIEAERLGYNHAMHCATQSEGAAEAVGRDLARMALSMRGDPNGPDCLITGGEPTVTLADPAIRGRGGRNQQLVLSSLELLGDCRDVALLSGGTDGEDGPTDAAGAVINAQIAATATGRELDTEDSLRRNDAYTFFEAAKGLLQTGPTHTNVCDIRVVTVSH